MSFLSRLLGFDQRKYAKIRDREGFRIATFDEVCGAYGGLRAMGGRAYQSPQNAIAFIEEAEKAIADKARVPFGASVGSLAHHWIDTDVEMGNEDAREAFVAPFRAAHQAKDSPFSAALYAKACMLAAFDARGSNWSHKTRASAWEGFARWSEESLGALGAFKDRYEEALETGNGHLFVPWAAQFFSSNAPQSSGPEDLVELFNYCNRSDPYDLHLIRDAGYYMLPRWFGKDETDIEALARACANYTQDVYGHGAYAYVYGHVAKLGDQEIETTDCDPQLLDQGYRDLRARFPSIRLHNDHLNALVWAGLNDRAHEEFKDLRLIDDMSWGIYDDEKAVIHAVSIYSQLNDRAA